MLSKLLIRTGPKRVSVNLALIFASILSAFALGEAGLRIYQWVRYGLPLGASGLSQAALSSSLQGIQLPNLLDRRLGWRSAPNYRFQGLGRNPDGSTYPLTVTKKAEGFREFGSLNTVKPKMLVIGDSFTEALGVSDGNTYYSLLGRSLGCEVFAIGSGGYGTLQEFMLLDQFIDQIHPDLILWQFCYNDFMDNSYALGVAWTAGSLSLTRPYWNNSRIEYHLPKPFPWLRETANSKSRLLYLVLTRLDKLLASPPNSDPLVQEIVSQGDNHKSFQQAAETTRQLLRKVAERAGSVPVVLFEAGTTASPFHPAIKRIARENGIHFVEDLPGVLDIEKAKGLAVNSPDGVHWNDTGQRIVATALEGYLRGNVQIQKRLAH